MVHPRDLIHAPTAALRVARLTLDALAGDHAAAWDDLAAHASWPNVFYERWMAIPAAALAPAPRPTWLACWRGDRLDALLPIAPRRRLGIAFAIENWDQSVRALGEPLIRAGAERDAWTALIATLDGRGLALRLSALIADSPSTTALRALLAGRAVYETRAYGRAVLNTGRSSDDHIAAAVRKKSLKEYKRLANRLANRGTVVFERLAPDADPNPWIADLFRLEMTGWKGRDGVAAAADPARERCYRAILTAAHQIGRLDFHRLTVRGRTIATLAAIEAAHDTAFQLKIAYDETWAAFSPGVLLELAYLPYALDTRRLSRVDSCARAGHPMIDRLWPDRLRVVSLAIPHRHAVSRLICAAQDRLRRARKPSSPTQS